MSKIVLFQIIRFSISTVEIFGVVEFVRSYKYQGENTPQLILEVEVALDSENPGRSSTNLEQVISGFGTFR